MHRKSSLLSLLLLFLVISGCTGLNPNVGTLTGDGAYNRGDCTQALDIYERRAKEGQPWAQTRMGIVYFEGKCKPKDYEKAVAWLKKAAMYEPTTAWENGKSFSTGPNGYFNTRTSSTTASSLLAHIYMREDWIGVDPVTAWLWANHAVGMAPEEHKPELETSRIIIERQMSTDQLQRAKELTRSWPPKN